MSLTNIYILDDDTDMLAMLLDMVEDAELSAVCFDQGKVFFEQVKSFENSSLLVLDLHMPEMDGIEVMRRLAKMNNPPALILISGHDIGVLHAAVKLGKAHNLKIISFIDKPIQLSHFQTLLQQFCESASITQAKTQPRLTAEFSPDEILEAINGDQLVLFYHPQIELATGRLVSCEALVRWLHPQKGLIFPDQFIGLVEKNGWMGELTNWVINEAVLQARKWIDRGNKLPISVNVSADNITSLLFPEQVSSILAKSGIKPTMLTLEVTESALMGELVTSLDILTRLRLKGLGLSIDDFGTGYSSLSQLHKIPFTELKIDQSFVISMLGDDEARAIVKTCIMLGHELNMLVVAEGVETEKHLSLLKEMGCDIAQGYYYSRPLAVNEFNQWYADYINQTEDNVYYDQKSN